MKPKTKRYIIWMIGVLTGGAIVVVTEEISLLACALVGFLSYNLALLVWEVL